MVGTSHISNKDSLLLVIDIQEKFRKVIFEFDRVVENTKKLVRSFGVLGIPVVVSEQYTKGLGKTVKEIKVDLKKSEIVEKISFDCFNDGGFLELIKKSGKKNMIICGIEAHVCVFQTVLSALSKGFTVHLIVDAVSSRKEKDYDIAIRRMENEGAKLASTEMIIFQMMKDSKDKNFKEISNIIK